MHPPQKVELGDVAIQSFERFIEHRYPFAHSGIAWNKCKFTEEVFFEPFDYAEVQIILDSIVDDYDLEGVWSLVCATTMIHLQGNIHDLVRFIPYMENIPEDELGWNIQIPICDDYWLFNESTGALFEVTHENEIFFAEAPSIH